MPPTEQLLLSVAEQAQAVGGRAQNSGLVTIPTAFLSFYDPLQDQAGAQRQPEEAALREENSSFLHFSAYVRVLSQQVRAEGFPGQPWEQGVLDRLCWRGWKATRNCSD